DAFNYNVSISSAGTYNVGVRHASPYSGKSFHVELDGSNVTGSMAATNTGGWDTWATVTKQVTFPAGAHTLKFVADTDGFNLNYIKVDAATGAPAVSI